MVLSNKDKIQKLKIKVNNHKSTIVYYNDLIKKQRREIGLCKVQMKYLQTSATKRMEE